MTAKASAHPPRASNRDAQSHLRRVAGLATMVRAHQELVEAEATIEDLEARIVEIAQDVMGADGAALVLLQGERLVQRAASGILAGRPERRVDRDAGLAGQALREGRVLVAADHELDPGLAAPGAAVGSLAVAPIRFRQTDLGVIEVASRMPDAFADEDREVADLLAALVGSALRRHEYESRLQRSERQYRMLFEHNPHPMWVFDVQTLRFLAVNVAALGQYGYSREEFLRMTLYDIRPESERPALQQALARLSGDQPMRGLRRHRRKNGETIDVEVTSDPIEFAGRAARLVLAHDVTLRLRAERERLEAEHKLAFQAAHDATSGLPRYALQEPQIAGLLARHDLVTAMLIVDLDRFKAVNESLGHRVGDHVLRRVAERIALFATPQVLVSHFAADEVLVALHVPCEQDAIALAERIRAAVAEPIEADGYRLVLSATVGIGLGPAHGATPLELTRAAQAATEYGKQQGRDQVALFRPEQQREIEERVTLGTRLRSAVERGELSLHFQPQFAAADHRLTGFEALLRWTSPELGPVSPARFITLAEALGLMPEIGAWVIRAACRQARAWLDRGHDGFTVAVNVSAQQLQRPGLVDTVTAALAEAGVPPRMLDIELTESSLMENVGRVQETLAELKRLGIRLSLDDFGTGYSSLAYLKTFSLDKLKIDQSFVRGLPGNRNDAALAGMIVSIGHQLNLVVAAEGVETAEQAEFLRGLGCDELQGYFFGRPTVPEAAAEHFGSGQREPPGLAPPRAF